MANSAPVLQSAPPQIALSTVEGDTSSQGVAVGTLLIGATDANGDALGVAITALDTSMGTWQYSLDGGATWLTVRSDLIDSSTDELALLLGPEDRIRILPFGDLNGSLANALTFRAWDRTDGSRHGSYAEITAHGGTTAFSDGTASASITVQAVYDAPSFASATAGPLLDVLGPIDAGFYYNDGHSVVVLPDGKLLIATLSANDVDQGVGILRLDADGTLDTTFGSGGKVLLPLNTATYPQICVAPDGSIVVLGTGGPPGLSEGSAVVRLDANGNLDPGFNGTGMLQVPIQGVASGMLLQPDGSVVVVSSHDGELAALSDSAAVIRIRADGSLDPGFGNGGTALFSYPSSYSDLVMAVEGRNVALLPDGSLILVDSMTVVTWYQYTGVRKVTPTGAIDDSFRVPDDTDSPPRPIMLFGDYGFRLADSQKAVVQADGCILMAGTNNLTGAAMLVRLLADGSPDPQFGELNGATVLALGGTQMQLRSVQVQPDGHIVVAGVTTDVNGSNHFAVVRLDSDGQLDSSFNGTGLVTLPPDGAYDLALQPDGRIVVVGYAVTASGFGSSTAVERLNADGSLDTTFNRADTLAGTIDYTQGGAPVVLDSSVGIFDPELSALGGGQGNYRGASVTLHRHGGASADDTFSATGSLSFSGSDALLSGVTIGSVARTGGVLTLSFNGNATQARVNEALSSIGYSNALAPAFSSVQIDWIFNDGNSGAQGSGGALSTTGSTTINVLASADAPVIKVGVPSDALVEAGGVANDAPGVATAWLTVGKTAVNGTASWDTAAMVSRLGWTDAGNGVYTKSGTYGTASFSAVLGIVSYVLDDTRAATQHLTEGQAVTESFTLQATDGTLASRGIASFDITGANDAPTVSAGVQSVQLVEAGGVDNGTPGTQSATISVTKADVDGTARWDTGAMLASGWTDAGAGEFTKSGSYGTASFDTATGVVTYTLDDTRASTQQLRAGQAASDSFTIQATDGASTAAATAVFDITGAEDAPTISLGAQSVPLVEAGGVADGIPGTSLATIATTKADVDGTAAWDTSAMVASLGWTNVGNGIFIRSGDFGSASFDLSTGLVTYTLDNTCPATQQLAGGQAATDTFTLQATDGTLTARSTASFGITGANDAPAVSAGAQRVQIVEAAGPAGAGSPGTPSATIVLTKSDVDGTANWDTGAMLASFGWTDAGAGLFTNSGTYGVASFDTGTGVVTYDLDNDRDATQLLLEGVHVSDSFTVQATDGALAARTTATFDVAGANDPPTISAGAHSVELVEAGGVANGTAGVAVATMVVTASDVDSPLGGWDTEGMIASFGWTDAGGGVLTNQRVFGSAAFNTSTGVLTYTLDDTRTITQHLAAGQRAGDSFSLQIGGYGSVAVGTVTFSITGANDAPTVSAGVQSAQLVEAGGVDNATAGTPCATVIVTKSDVDSTASWDTGEMVSSMGWTDAGAGLFTRSGTYGTASFDTATGVVTYTLDDTRVATQQLAAGQAASDSFMVQVTDGSLTANTTATFDITGANDAPAVTVNVQSVPLVEAGGVANGTPGTSIATITASKADLDGHAAWDTVAMVASLGWTDAGKGVLTQSGAFGSASFDLLTGVVTYTLDDTRPATQQLHAGQAASDSFILQASDGTLAGRGSATFDVTGANDAPMVSAGVQSLQLVEAGGVDNGTPGNASATVTITKSDVDGTASWDACAMLSSLGWSDAGKGILTRSGVYGTASFDIATGDMSYQLDDSDPDTQALTQGQLAQDSFSVQVTDGSLTAVCDAVFSIRGSNDTPVLRAAPPAADLVEAGGTFNTSAGRASTTLQVDKGDVDGTVNWDLATMASRYGWYPTADGRYISPGVYGMASFDTASGTVTYTLDDNDRDTQRLVAGQRATDSFMVVATDGIDRLQAVARFGILGADDAPVVTVSPQSAPLGGSADAQTPPATLATIGIGRSDVDGIPRWDTAAMTSVWGWTVDASGNFSRAAAFGSLSLDATTGRMTYTLDLSDPDTRALAAGEPALDSMTVQVTDGLLATTADATFRIIGVNDAPTVTASPQRGPLLEAGGAANGEAGSPVASIEMTKADVDGPVDWDIAAMTSALNWKSASGGVYTQDGLYGSASFDPATGIVTYSLRNDDPATQALTGGQLVHESFAVQVTDGTATASADAVFSLTGADDAPVITLGSASSTVSEAGGLGNATPGQPAATIRVAASDVDGVATWDGALLASLGWSALGNGRYAHAGLYGTATLDSGSAQMSYLLDDSRPATQALRGGVSVEDSFWVESTDGTLSTRALASFTVVGADDAPAPVGALAPCGVQAGQSWTWKLPEGAFADAEGDPLQYEAHLQGGAALPAWLHFDGRTGTFDAAVPAGTAPVDALIEIGALDPQMLALREAGQQVQVGTLLLRLSVLPIPGSVIVGTPAPDTLVGTPGNDTIDGGASLDLLVYSGERAQYSTTRTAGGVTVAGPEGTDSVVNVERLKFADRYVAFDDEGTAGQIYRLYQAAFDRAPDLPGLGFQIDAADHGLGLRQIAANFLASPEFQSLYGSLSDLDFVLQLYRNVLHREGEQAGIDYHMARIASGIARSDILLGFSESPEDKAQVQAAVSNGMDYMLAAGQSIRGTASDDTLAGTQGNDTIDGQGGRDVLVCEGGRSDYTILKWLSGYLLSGPEGVDTLTSVERIRFDDASVALDLDGAGGQAFRLYHTALDRAPDAAGLGSLIDSLDHGATLSQLAMQFVSGPGFPGTDGQVADADFVRTLYQHIRHADPSAGELGYYVSLLASGVSRGDVLVNFSESPENQAALAGLMQNGITYVP